MTSKSRAPLKISDAANFTADVGATAGHTVYYDLKVSARDGREFTLAKNLNNKPEADWLARQLTAAAKSFQAANPQSMTAKLKTHVPVRWRKEVERVLITEEQIARRVKTLAREIERDFRGRETVVVSLLERHGDVSRGFDPAFESAVAP